MEVYEVKDKEQKRALNAWAKNNFIGSVIAGTGFGKSRVIVLGVGYSLRKAPEEKALVLTPTVQLQAQLEEEFRKWGYDDIIDRVDIMCYQSAHKLKNVHYHIIACDEIHLGLSPVYRKVFENNSYERLLCVTATFPEENEYLEVLVNLARPVYTITLDECVAKGLVAPYEVYCIPVTLTDEELAAYKKANNLFVHAKYRLGQFDAFENASKILSGKMQGDKAAAAMFYKAIRDRKTVVQLAENKLTIAEEIVKKHKGSKTLVFSGTNDFTDMMANTLKGLAYHSGKSKKKREQILEEYKENKNKILCSTKALNQGFDVPDSEIGIVAGLDSKALPMIQRIGRLLRLSKDKVGKIYILYIKDSQEEKWLTSAIKQISNVKWVNSIHDVKI